MENIIEVKNLVKDFKDVRAVDNVTFNVRQGEIFAFLGPNGAGKTTTIKMLTTLLRPTSGEIKVNGFNPVTEQDDTRHSFGIVFQDPSLDEDLTAKENMEIHGVMYGVPNKLLNERTRQLLELVELWEKRNTQVKDFSGGMKRRLEIARGLLHHPKIIFLDEPTLGLDPQTRNHIWNYIHDLNEKEGITVFFSTHYMEEAERVADEVAIIDHGKIIIQGTAKELEEKTKTNSLEDAFLALTGKAIREEGKEGWAAKFRGRN
ncbi:MAG: ATP-binding cassette domain-containing protein [Candidatus Pacebacteria bacterium]|nr:ATP-binding cassette domain-containing protein [Candidatus Paceibacterota bacterium]